MIIYRERVLEGCLKLSGKNHCNPSYRRIINNLIKTIFTPLTFYIRKIFPGKLNSDIGRFLHTNIYNLNNADPEDGQQKEMKVLSFSGACFLRKPKTPIHFNQVLVQDWPDWVTQYLSHFPQFSQQPKRSHILKWDYHLPSNSIREIFF